MTDTVKFNILDFVARDLGKNDTDAYNDTLHLAKRAEELGYHRFWFAEHHSLAAYPSAAPEIMMTYLLSQTKRLKFGSGGVMLPHYAPLKVAEVFNTIAHLYPGRVDLGMGNNPGRQAVRDALDSNLKCYKDNEEAMREVRDFVSQAPNNYGDLQVYPRPATPPTLWTLSASEASAYKAARLGIGYVYSLLFNQDEDAIEAAGRIAKIYRDNFQPSATLAKPQFMVSAFIAVVPEGTDIKPLQRAFELWILGKKDYSEFDHLPTIEEAANYQFTEADHAKMARNRKKLIIGDIQQVKGQIEQIIQLTAADEFMVIPTVPGVERRQEHVELIAQAFDL